MTPGFTSVPVMSFVYEKKPHLRVGEASSVISIQSWLHQQHRPHNLTFGEKLIALKKQLFDSPMDQHCGANSASPLLLV